MANIIAIYVSMKIYNFFSSTFFLSLFFSFSSSIFRTIFTKALHLICNLVKYRGVYNMSFAVKISA